VAATSQEARRRWRPYLEHYRDFAMAVRSSFGREIDFDSLLQGPAICGCPAEVVDRIGQIDELLGLDRHLFLIDIGGIPNEVVADVMHLMATEVLPHLG
jgi:alkanesulfonate monooxygenase SsuD/methylene tetrahydromethanopterin reductase-like flavin-dependent oxidoreductase (luciferase family)